MIVGVVTDGLFEATRRAGVADYATTDTVLSGRTLTRIV